jgi:hypothetical protein
LHNDTIRKHIIHKFITQRGTPSLACFPFPHQSVTLSQPSPTPQPSRFCLQTASSSRATSQRAITRTIIRMLANASRTNVWRLVGLSKTSTINLSHGLAPRSVLQVHNVWNGSSIARRLLATATSDAKPPAANTTRNTKKRITSIKSPTKRRTTPKKATSRKKKAAARPKLAKKILSPEQKEKAKAKKERETVRELKRLALEKPKLLPRSAWLVVNAEFASKGKSGINEAAAKYKSLASEERMV